MLEGMNARIAKYALGAQLSAQDLRQVEHYYVSRAPESTAESEPEYAPSPIEFQAVMIGAPPPAPGSPGFQPPAIGDVLITDLDGDGDREVLVSDGRADELRWIHRVGAETVSEDALARLPAPARKEVADLDADGRADIVVACLGSMIPTMARVGQVLLLRGEARGFSQRAILSGVARVSDVRVADLDRDGDLDVAYAAFGSYKMGEVGWLEQRGDGSFARRVLLERSGVSHVPIADLDGDGALDVVALVSQEHEELLAFFGDGRGGFELRTLFRAEHPMFGMAGIEMADMDSDADVDIVFANGDALDDDLFPKPWHGVRWLESTGGRRFELHEVVRFPGAYALASGDLDGDGDRGSGRDEHDESLGGSGAAERDVARERRVEGFHATRVGCEPDESGVGGRGGSGRGWEAGCRRRGVLSARFVSACRQGDAVAQSGAAIGARLLRGMGRDQAGPLMGILHSSSPAYSPSGERNVANAGECKAGDRGHRRGKRRSRGCGIATCQWQVAKG